MLTQNDLIPGAIFDHLVANKQLTFEHKKPGSLSIESGFRLSTIIVHKQSGDKAYIDFYKSHDYCRLQSYLPYRMITYEYCNPAFPDNLITAIMEWANV